MLLILFKQLTPAAIQIQNSKKYFKIIETLKKNRILK